MPVIHETAYPYLKRQPNTDELARLYTPTRAECALAARQTKGPVARIGFLVLLKTFQRLGYFVRLADVPKPITARAVLAAYLPTLPIDGMWLFVSNKQQTLPDSMKQPAPLGERALGFIVAKYARLGKVPDLSPHDLRHRFGYRMAQTVPLHRLAQIMGHDSLDTTMLYVQGTKQDLQLAVESIAWL